jgi:hypothetical protein
VDTLPYRTADCATVPFGTAQLGANLHADDDALAGELAFCKENAALDRQSVGGE